MSSQNAILSNILFLFIFRFPLLLSNYNFILYEFQFKQKEEKSKFEYFDCKARNQSFIDFICHECH
jgi:hypothetical protein